MKQLTHKFLKNIPDALEEGVLYVSVEYATCIHKCVCGCGNEVVTPLSPTDWKLSFNGNTVSLHPSIGNWSLECQSHYWITNDEVEWASKWSRNRIERNRNEDRQEKEVYYTPKKKQSFFHRFKS